jgi:hypothetical protein
MFLAIPSARGAAVGSFVSNTFKSAALDLNFASTKSLVDSATGLNLVTFTRASSATYIDSAGTLQTAAVDVPRFDHNPTTGESLGLLVEEQRTNSLTYSEDTSQWLTPTNITLSQNQTTAPDGASTADQYLETAATGLHVQDGMPFTFVTSTAYTYSVFVKSIGGRNFEIGYPPTTFTNRFARFNLSGSGSVQGSDAGVTASIQAYANGWYRCSATNTCALGASARISNFANNDSFARSYAGDVTKGLFIWGAQLEAGAFPTSYIPTTTAAVTRSADVATITSIGSNVRSLFAQFRSPASGTRPVVSLDDNTANERIEILTSGTDPKLLVTDGGSTVADLDGGTVAASVTARAAAAFDTNNYAFSVDGGASQLDTSGTLPTVNRIRIGSNQAGGYFNGTIARVVGWATALTNLPSITQ